LQSIISQLNNRAREFNVLASRDINTELGLLQAVANGDEKAFETLYRYYYEKLYLFLLKVTQNQHGTASDILQEAFLRVWLNRDRLMEIENFQAWIYKVVSTEALTSIRKELHIKAKANRLKSKFENSEFGFCHEKPTELTEIRLIVKQAVQRLPQQRQTIYMLSREEGLSPVEIAKKLNISVNTVYNTLTSALKYIRQQLSVAGYGMYLGVLAILGLL
jgi:RNA polymerase sigma-70 factor (ECF subfamily)